MNSHHIRQVFLEQRIFCSNLTRAQLLEAIREYLSSSKAPKLEVVPKTDNYVLDGGSLLRRLKWKEGSTQRSVAEMHASFTVDNYGKATVVFDGCTGRPSTKTMPISDGAPKLKIRLIYQLQHNLLAKRISSQIT